MMTKHEAYLKASK